MNSKNTGNYRICREKKGIEFGKPISSDIYNSEVEVIKLKNIIQKENPEWEYYCEEEVVFEKTHSDNEGHRYDSEPTWRRIKG